MPSHYCKLDFVLSWFPQLNKGLIKNRKPHAELMYTFRCSSFHTGRVVIVPPPAQPGVVAMGGWGDFLNEFIQRIN